MSIQSTSNSSMYSDSYRLRKRIYYINTNEIPSKLLHENMIFAKYWCTRFSIESMFRRQTKCLFNPTSHSSSTSESYKLRNIRVLHNNGIINDESLSAVWEPRVRSFYLLHFVTKLKIHHPSSSILDHVKSIRFFFSNGLKVIHQTFPQVSCHHFSSISGPHCNSCSSTACAT